ncbi:MAG: Carboxymuconolactone decarboxylase family protein [Candidatus Dependentiae bacterium ADurb.Bin331]|nr:MAG: Carboxymuconolactone decarboxylase family protein [Candidatus Dependentiae bacterium ADurb.Bin331]
MKYGKNLFVMLFLFSTSTNAQAPHISVPATIPGISSLFVFRPETAQPLRELAQILLYDESTLSRGERELIASYVSYRNNCNFCCNSHSAIATHHLNGDQTIVQAVKNDVATAPVSEKMKALLTLAGQVQQSGRMVTQETVAQAKEHGATDKEIHDTVLIAAAFCMYNRYVDGLAAFTPTEQSAYDAIGKIVGEHGYVRK